MAHTRKRKKKPTFVEEVKADGVLTELEMRKLRMRMNKGTVSYDEASKLIGMKITPEQTQKGLKWLKDKWKTPKGKERLNNPFGFREQRVIENFKEFRLADMFNNTFYGSDWKNYVPVWDVIAKDGSGFQYYMEGGEPKIIG